MLATRPRARIESLAGVPISAHGLRSSHMSRQEVGFSGELFLEVTTSPTHQSAIPDGTADAVVTGRVESAAGSGLSGLTVAVVRDETGSDDEVAARAETDVHGDFRLVVPGLGALSSVTLHVQVSMGS